MDEKAYPAKLFIEPTTSCNLQCRMCVKQSRGSGIVEGILSKQRYTALSKIFPQLDTVVFSGIGEPLLNPELETMIAAARVQIPPGSWIGLQTNGHLLDDDRAATLVAAGIDRICVSMDAASDNTLQLNRSGAAMDRVENALQAVTRAGRKQGARRIQLGIEFVLMRNNFAQLPRALAQAAAHGATFAIVSQMLPYDERVMGDTLYSANTDASLEFFRERQAAARARGLDLKKYLSVRWNYKHSTADQALIAFVEAMIAEAAERQIPFHFRKLLAYDESLSRELKTVFDQSRQVADKYDLDLMLPALHPRHARRCEFVQNKSIFMAWDGRIYPCYMLWHQYRCFLDGREKTVAFEAFGRVPERDILAIWRDRHYAAFRNEVNEDAFPYCSNCNIGPCDLITSEEFEYDCFAMAVPCGDCPWCMGLMQCLQ